ncbi:hypothetical protein Hdeb2414_s0012g00392721 [Helianthus debilis subsp. tardiflorus]
MFCGSLTFFLIQGLEDPNRSRCKLISHYVLSITPTLACSLTFFSFFLIAEGVVNGLVFTIARPFNWIGSRMDFNPGINGPSEDVSRVLARAGNWVPVKTRLDLFD